MVPLDSSGLFLDWRSAATALQELQDSPKRQSAITKLSLLSIPVAFLVEAQPD
jgi:hypothetical protein